ncbi:hypothetical protein [Jannaschia formosa]|uniref:hypothetical protein n=1 Tax=Jannaschia formosa TaxID=2259592 RepID=UPI000E1C0A5A|nr:hypothetical protein [Jannaschia formosa]TFL18253.1 hypothetical protein DR046_10925 [Jannaschia formosa]
MSRFLALALAALAAAGPKPAAADHYMQTADPQVVQAIQEIVWALGQGCNAGNAGACQAIPMAQQQAHMMLSAGYDCRMQNDPQACQFYQANLQQLQQSYQQVAQAMQTGALMQPQGGMGGGGAMPGMGSTHEERMQQIHNWGQQRLEWGRQNQTIMDNSHQRFLETLRQ